MSCDSPKFIVDFMLGKLARNLRLLGFDTVYIRHLDRESLFSRMLEEERILLTRAHCFPERDDVFITDSDDPYHQTREVIRAFKLIPHPFARCTVCNFPLESVEKTEVKEHVPPYVYRTHREFSRCPSCGRIYWKGTHYEKISRLISEILEEE